MVSVAACVVVFGVIALCRRHRNRRLQPLRRRHDVTHPQEQHSTTAAATAATSAENVIEPSTSDQNPLLGSYDDRAGAGSPVYAGY